MASIGTGDQRSGHRGLVSADGHAWTERNASRGTPGSAPAVGAPVGALGFPPVRSTLHPPNEWSPQGDDDVLTSVTVRIEPGRLDPDTGSVRRRLRDGPATS